MPEFSLRTIDIERHLTDVARAMQCQFFSVLAGASEVAHEAARRNWMASSLLAMTA
jgi:hypothetical protein